MTPAAMRCEHKIHQRPGESDADIPLPGRRTGLLRFRTRFIENGYAAERQKNHCLGNQPGTLGHEHVSGFVGRDAGQHDSNQCQVPRSVGRAVAVEFRPENEQRQDQERQVKPNLDSEQAPDVNGKTSHEVSATTVILHGRIYWLP